METDAAEEVAFRLFSTCVVGLAHRTLGDVDGEAGLVVGELQHALGLHGVWVHDPDATCKFVLLGPWIGAKVGPVSFKVFFIVCLFKDGLFNFVQLCNRVTLVVLFEND